MCSGLLNSWNYLGKLQHWIKINVKIAGNETTDRLLIDSER